MRCHAVGVTDEMPSRANPPPHHHHSPRLGQAGSLSSEAALESEMDCSGHIEAILNYA